MYGTRDAARRWEECYPAFLLELGVAQGRASPCCFVHAERELKIVVYGGDFTVLGPSSSLAWFHEVCGGRFDIKRRALLGPESGDDHEVTILNRVVRWDASGIRYEADPRHAKLLAKQLGLVSAQSVTSPGVNGE